MWIDSPEYVRYGERIFPARITAKSDEYDDVWRYGFAQQEFSPFTGEYTDAVPGIQGTPGTNWATELSNALVDVGTLVWMRLKGSVAQEQVYEFVAPDMSDGSYSTSIGDGIASSITVTHNLLTRELDTIIIRNSDFQMIQTTVTYPTINTATITFSTIPTTDQYHVTIFSRGGTGGSGSVTITGGTINNAVIGGTTPAAATFTSLIVTSSLSTNDGLIKLGRENSADTIDLGFYSQYTSSGTKHTGLFRDASDGKYRLFTGLQDEPSTTVDITGTGYTDGTLVVGVLETGNSGLKIRDTDNSHSLTIKGGTNLSDNRIWTITTPDAAFTTTFPATGTVVIADGVPSSQTIKGGTGASENLTLQSTAHATPGFVDILASSGDTNSIRTMARVRHITSGTAAAGFGSATDYTLEDASGNEDSAARIATVWTTATHASEAADWTLGLMTGGTLAEAIRVISGGAIRLPERASPGTPATGYGSLYIATDGTLHVVDDAGTNTALGTARTQGTLTALGSTQGDAAPIITSAVVVSGADGTVGVRLPATGVADIVAMENAGVPVALKVYPQSGGQIGNNLTDTAVSITSTGAIFYRVSATKWLHVMTA